MTKFIAAIAALLSTNAMAESPIQFIKASREGLIIQTSSHKATWHLGEEENWAADLDAGTITFQFSSGVKATAPIQVIGTYNLADSTFLWGWDHPSVPEALRKHAILAKQWGEKNKVNTFVSRKVKCSEDDAWGFSAVANRLANANGVYRGPAGSAVVFMTFGEIKLEKKP